MADQAAPILPEVMVRRLAPNSTGRDFVVGDIHGAYDAVKGAMRQVGFDPARDRLISVGDLVDRGLGSSRVTRFLAQPYVFAVRGNHEHELAKLQPSEVRLLATLPRLGMTWARNLSDEAIFEIQDAVRRLPLAIELQTARGLVGIVHAQPLPGISWPQFVQRLEARDPAAIECALTSRARIRDGDMSVVAGVGRVYVGHTIQAGGPRIFGNVVAIDTGAVLRELGIDEGHHLTLINAAAKTGDIRQVADAARHYAAIDSEGDGAFGALRASS
jgi:serine/threonine protein phosphatase 1